MSKAKFIWALSLLAMTFVGCSDDKQSDKSPKKDQPVTPIEDDIDDGMSLSGVTSSVTGCLIDSDCAGGSFCFESQCVLQCDEERECDTGYACQISRGRCIQEGYLQNLVSAIQELDAKQSEMSKEEVALAKAILDLESVEQSEVNLNRAQNKGLSLSDFISRVPSGVILDPQKDKQQVTIRLRKDAGIVYYAVRADDQKLPILKKATAVKTVENEYEYNFEIQTSVLRANKKKLLRDGGEEFLSTSVDIVSTVGNSKLLVFDSPEMSGIYSGHVVPGEVLSGIDLPIRMGIKVIPESARTFDEIESMILMLPVSQKDVFSPENVSFDSNGKGKETWASVEIAKKDDASACRSERACFAAVFSTNDFAPAGSMILDGSRHVNRNIRIEITGMNAADGTVTGHIIDRLDGIYREVTDNTNPSNKKTMHWNSTEMSGIFSVKGKDVIDEDKLSIHVHVADAETYGDIAEAPSLACTDEQIVSLVSHIVNPYNNIACNTLTDDEDIAKCNQYVVCTEIKSISAWKKTDVKDKAFCINSAVSGIELDETRGSAVLKNVLISDALSTENEKITVCGKQVGNFEDFRTLCADEDCDLCKEHPEYACAVDLLASLYRDGDELSLDEKTAISKNWVSMMNESNLLQQYLSWNNDIEIRKSWLTGAVYEDSFAESVMSTYNTGLLSQYHTKVLDVHRSILQGMTRQSVLEMLSVSNADGKDGGNSELSSARNEILSQIATAWENLSDSLGLMTRRYDVLSQDDLERVSVGAELRAYLFDLYYVGLVASELNLQADQGSLNGSFGANLASIMGKLESLDQPFEELVFMRDGEIFIDSRQENGPDTALGVLRTNAKTAVEKAVSKREEVFSAIEKKNGERLSVQDSYLSSLESMRAKLVDLCGYPADCTTPKQRESCQIFTAPYFCGFALDSLETAGVDIRKIAKSDNSEMISSIKQINNYYDCILKNSKLDSDGKIEASKVSEATYQKCLGAGMVNDAISVSYSGANISKAGQAIERFRLANRSYDAAVAEYNIQRQKAENTNIALGAYAESLSKRYQAMMATFDSISSSLDVIQKYEKAFEDYQVKVDKTKINNLYEDYQAQKDNFDNWMKIAGASQAIPDLNALVNGAIQSYILINQKISGGITYKSLEQVGMSSIISALFERNSAFYAAHAEEYYAVGDGAAAAYFDLFTNMELVDYAIVNIDVNYMLNEKYTAIATLLDKVNSEVNTQFSFQEERLKREVTVDEAKAQIELAETIAGIKSAVELYNKTCAHSSSSSECKATQELSGLEMEHAIAALERENALLLKQMTYKDQIDHEIQDLEIQRNEFKNSLLDLIDYERMVYVKQLEREKALLEYFEIVQEAENVADMLDAKLERFQKYNDLMGSASEFFQYARDIEDVETYIEYARNDLSDYLTAIEYLTVRPFVELRRSIYTARGTNDFEMIYEKLNDLTKNCGSGDESETMVTLSLKNRMGLPDTSINDLTSDEKMMLSFSSNNLPADAKNRYSAIGDMVKSLSDGTAYSGTFTLTPSFAHISNSCNAKIKEIQVRFVSREGKQLRESANSTPYITLVYGGQSQLLSCHEQIEAITKSIGDRTSFGKYSTFTADPVANGINAGVYEVPMGTSYKISSSTEFPGVTKYKSLKGYPLMASYTVIIDPQKGENKNIKWSNIGDVELQIIYTTGTLGQESSNCSYDI